MIDPLTRLAITHGTDKFGYHDYTPNYHTLFEHLKDAPIRLLEIGVGGYQDADRGGESLEVWRDYFPNGHITGLDIQKKELDLGARVTILQGSQVDPEFLARTVSDHGPFDIIIDDGSHQNEHVVTSFGLLFPTLAAGGIYVAEDVQTSFFPRFGGSLTLEAPNSVGFFRDMFVARAASTGASAAPDGVAKIRRFHNMVAIFKAPLLPEDSNDKGPVLLVGADQQIEAWRAENPEREGASLVAHGKTPSAKAVNKIAKSDGPFDLIVDLSDLPAAQNVPRLFPTLATGGTYRAEGPTPQDMDWFAQRFVEVDHREIVVNFPDFKAGDLARDIYSISGTDSAVSLLKSANDYPSNFGFDYEHPQALAAFDAMEEVLLAEGGERGLLLFTDIMTRAGHEERAAPMLKKLDGMAAQSRVFFNVAVRRAKLDQDWAHAMELLLKAVDLYPEDYRIRSQLGSLHSKARDWDKAEAELQKGVDLAPRDPLLRIQLANALSQLSRPDEAVESAQKAVELAPDHAGHHVQLGRLQINAEMCEEAIETLQKAIALNPEIANAHRQLSRAFFALDRLEEARQSAKTALDLRPDSGELQRWHESLARG